MKTSADHVARARELWLKLRDLDDWDETLRVLAGALAEARTALLSVDESKARAIRNATIEEIAAFAETHFCIIDVKSPGGYKTETRAKHPNEPFARAIRAMKEQTS